MLKLRDIQDARRRIRADIRITPLLPAPDLISKNHVFLKLENMQRTGSFKDRGALHKLLSLRASGSRAGIVAASAGNHAQAVSYHAQRLGFPATIVMPSLTPFNKVASTKRWGATIVLEGANFDEAMTAAQEIARRKKRTLVHAFDDDDVIAGQGTLGLELLEQIPEIDTLIVPVGGGGLASGTAMAIKEQRPRCRIIGVQAENCAFVLQRFGGRRRAATHYAATIGEGIAIKHVSDRTLRILRKYLDDMVAVSEEELANAVLHLLERSKVLAEGAGAAATAALMAGKVRKVGKNVVAVVSGGNIDVNLISRIIEKGLAKTGRMAHLHVVIPDRPGGLRGLASLFADLQANILQIHHERTSARIPLDTTGTDVVLETRGPEHVKQILWALRERRYRVEQLA